MKEMNLVANSAICALILDDLQIVTKVTVKLGLICYFTH